MEQPQFELKKDEYSHARRYGYSRFIDIFCGTCDEHVALYQKDGLWMLKRLYMDRIVAPAELVESFENSSSEELSDLECSHCETHLGRPSMYEPENRLAYELIEPIRKQSNPGVYPPPH